MRLVKISIPSFTWLSCAFPTDQKIIFILIN
jgi:hypothetical protein